METKQIPIGQLMLQMNYINADQLSQALTYQKQHPGQRLGDVMIELGMITEDEKLQVLSRRFDVPVYKEKQIVVSKEIAQLVSESIAEKYQIMPVSLHNDNLVVATSDPLDLQAFEDIKASCGIPIEVVLAHKSLITEAIRTNYSKVNVAAAIAEINQEYDTAAPASSASLTEVSADDRIDSAPIVKFINNLIKQAYGQGASDIHVEPFADETRIRIRVDGVLRDYIHLDRKVHEGLVTRLKIMGGMNIAEHRLPQDGRIDMDISGRNIDIRLSSLPTIYGEKMVIRLLGYSLQDLDTLNDLGLDSENYQLLKRLIHNPYGIVLVSGPTGSGKTTSLYACLHEIMSEAVNIVTVEDPVERKIKGINQVQVNNRAGLTFANGLRSILRQDPDCIMIGEIRDAETAEIAVSSAITGHLVLSTIHTNDTATAINRLVDMGVEPYLISSSVLGIVAQRLVRKVCPHCRQPYTPTAAEKELLGSFSGPIYQASGCSQCNGYGYQGRTAVFEIMNIDPAMREMITNKVPSSQLKKYAVDHGMKTLAASTLELVKNGTTTISEFMRVVYNVNQ